MQVYRTETKVSQDGKLTIKGLPFRKGESVEVIILTQKQKLISKSYPLHGHPVQYSKPYDPVDDDEWNAQK